MRFQEFIEIYMKSKFEKFVKTEVKIYHQQ
jgi:hypothetical protein